MEESWTLFVSENMPSAARRKKMQLDVGVSPPAKIMTFRPGITHFTFDLDPRDL